MKQWRLEQHFRKVTTALTRFPPVLVKRARPHTHRLWVILDIAVAPLWGGARRL